jgi:hypothetical protein
MPVLVSAVDGLAGPRKAAKQGSRRELLRSVFARQAASDLLMRAHATACQGEGRGADLYSAPEVLRSAPRVQRRVLPFGDVG